jgi:hypothetical protein
MHVGETMGDPAASWLQPSVLSPLVTAALVVVAAWISYLASKRRKISDISKIETLISSVQPHVLSFTDSSVRTSPRNIRSLKWVLVLPNIGLTALSLYFFGVTPATRFDVFIALLLIAYLFIPRHEPPSRTIKRAELVSEDTPKRLMERSLVALREIGCETGTYDVERGIIEAKRSKSFSTWPWGQIIFVSVSWAGNESIVRITVDHALPSALLGSGANARLVRKFKTAML